MSSLNILIDARMITGSEHGIARYAVNLIRGLAELGHGVSILSHEPETRKIIGSEFIKDEVRCNAPFASPFEAWQLTRELDKRMAGGDVWDIVHFPSFSVPSRVPPRTVVTIHDLIHLKPPSNLLHQIYYRTFVRRALNRCASVITVSDWSKADLVRVLGVNADKIHVIRNGLEPEWFTPESIASELEITRPYVICVSNPKPHKNVKTLIAACESLWRSGMDFNLALSLGGADLPKSWINRDFQKRLHLLKNVTQADLMTFYKNASVLVSPSFYEGFDLPAAEALALGTPALLSAGSAHSEFKSSLAKFYEPANSAPALATALRNSLENPNPNRSHGQGVSTSRQMADETVLIYKSLLGHP